jgi:hypothetical protein
MAKQQFNTRFPERIHKIVENWAEELGISKTEFVIRAIEAHDAQLWEKHQQARRGERNKNVASS